MCNNKSCNPETHYLCAMCNEVYEKGRSDEEAAAELLRDFGHVPVEECDLVCDTCYATTGLREFALSAQEQLRLEFENICGIKDGSLPTFEFEVD